MSKFIPFPVEDAEVLLNGPVGSIEALVAHPGVKAGESIAVICHPNPTQGGTMHNKVVTTLHKVFTLAGITTVRFNYRGVGNSEGSFAQGVGELDDLLAVIAWVKFHFPAAPIMLAGFSFGGYIALQGASRIDARALLTVAPSVGHFDCSDLAPISCPWVVAQGEDDDVVPMALVLDWLQTRKESPIVLSFPKTGHFFHGKLLDLRERLFDAVSAL